MKVVIHIILTPAAGIADLPFLMDGKAPPPGETENLGSRNYELKARALVTGGVSFLLISKL